MALRRLLIPITSACVGVLLGWFARDAVWQRALQLRVQAVQAASRDAGEDFAKGNYRLLVYDKMYAEVVPGVPGKTYLIMSRVKFTGYGKAVPRVILHPMLNPELVYGEVYNYEMLKLLDCDAANIYACKPLLRDN